MVGREVVVRMSLQDADFLLLEGASATSSHPSPSLTNAVGAPEGRPEYNSVCLYIRIGESLQRKQHSLVVGYAYDIEPPLALRDRETACHLLTGIYCTAF